MQLELQCPHRLKKYLVKARVPICSSVEAGPFPRCPRGSSVVDIDWPGQTEAQEAEDVPTVHR